MEVRKQRPTVESMTCALGRHDSLPAPELDVCTKARKELYHKPSQSWCLCEDRPLGSVHSMNCECIWFPLLHPLQYNECWNTFKNFFFQKSDPPHNERIIHTYVVQGGLCFWYWFLASCVLLPHPGSRTSWLTTQDRCAPSQGVTSGGFQTCTQFKDCRARLCLYMMNM